MTTKKEIIGSVLFRELAAIRTDSLWRMLACLRRDQLPDINEEGATGKLDNKGAIFIPGGMINQDVDGKEIAYDPVMPLNEKAFRKTIRRSMRYDNATLLFPDGVADSVNLDSGFFTRAARRIYNFKTAAFKRKRKIGQTLPGDIDATDIIRSHCPTYVDPPYGSRTRISTCVSVGLIDPHMYLAYCKTEFSLSGRRLKDFADRLDTAIDSAELPDGTVLYHPHVIVCHDTRYKENSLTGLIRILGIGKFGEFSTFTLERISNQLLGELKRKKIDYGPEHIFAEHEGTQALGLLRTYDPTNPGKRSKKYRVDILSPEKDLGLDLADISEQAIKRYCIDPDRP